MSKRIDKKAKVINLIEKFVIKNYYFKILNKNMKELNLKDILDNSKELKKKKVWYVAIVWRPNAGKSTFINTLIWEKVSIVTNVPQTTRNKILAVYNDTDSQIIFFDTPWIHKSTKSFNEEINAQAIKSFKDAELALYFIDSSRKVWDEEKYIEELIKDLSIPVFKVYTKIDLTPQIELKEEKNNFFISSQTKEWFDVLLENIKKLLEIWTTFFEDDFYTKQNIFFRISEIIREKVFNYTKEEIPHSIFVNVDEVDDQKDILKIVAYIYTESTSQKYIVIWKWWNLIKNIWKDARIELEKIFGKKVFLALRVKTKEKWRNDKKFVEKMLNRG